MGWRGERMALANIRASRNRRLTPRILRLRATRFIWAYATKRLEGEPWGKGWPRKPGLCAAYGWLPQEDECSIPGDETRTQEYGRRCADDQDQRPSGEVAQRPDAHDEQRV